MNSETSKLLKECNSGCKAAVDNMNQVKEHISSEKLRQKIDTCSDRHTEIGERCRNILCKNGEGECNPPAVGMAFAHIGTEIKLAINDKDKHIAEMMADGASMGMKSISKVINLYENASDESRRIASELIGLERNFFNDMLEFM